MFVQLFLMVMQLSVMIVQLFLLIVQFFLEVSGVCAYILEESTPIFVVCASILERCAIVLNESVNFLRSVKFVQIF